MKKWVMRARLKDSREEDSLNRNGKEFQILGAFNFYFNDWMTMNIFIIDIDYSEVSLALVLVCP